MTKRVLSLLLVVCFSFSGFFSVFGSAFSPWEFVLERGLEDILNGENVDFWFNGYDSHLDQETLQERYADSRLGKIANHPSPKPVAGLIHWEADDDVLVPNPSRLGEYFCDSPITTYQSVISAITTYLAENCHIDK